jgi:hypothetical protein
VNAQNGRLDEIPVPRRVDHCEAALGSLKLFVVADDGDAPLPLLLQVVDDPGILEGCLAPLG